MHKFSLIITSLIILAIAGEVFILIKNKNFKSQDTSSLKNPCIDSLNTNQYQCWEDFLDLTLKQKGITEAFLAFDYLYKNEPQFASGCHGYAHRLGEVTHQLMISGKDFDFPSQTAYCGYGFYHGLTELLLQTKGVEEAGKLCDSKKSQITQILYDACYHGIGHGTLSSTAQDSKIWGNVQEMINFALNLCTVATSDPIQQSRCASGVFMELGNYYIEGKLQLAPIQDDPLSICRKQQDFGKMDCYTQMNAVLNRIADGKLSRSAKFVEAIEEDKYAVEAIITLVGPTIDITKKDFTDDVAVCRSLQERLHLPCIKGLVLGFMLRSQPGIEYEDAINFCNLSILSEEERQSCFDLMLSHSKAVYTPDIMNTICKKVDLSYKRNYCPNN